MHRASQLVKFGICGFTFVHHASQLVKFGTCGFIFVPCCLWLWTTTSQIDSLNEFFFLMVVLIVLCCLVKLSHSLMFEA